MAAKGGLNWTSDTLTPSLSQAHDNAIFYLSRTTEYYSLHAETYAKSKAPWTDRTGNARSGLSSQWQANVGSEGSTFHIDIYHRVPYGIWLEVRYGGKWSIINKTVQIEGNKFFKTANQVMAKIFGGGPL